MAPVLKPTRVLVPFTASVHKARTDDSIAMSFQTS